MKAKKLMILFMLYISIHIFTTDGMKNSEENCIDDLKKNSKEKSNDIDCDSYNPEDYDDQYKYLEYSAENDKSKKSSADGQLNKRKRKERNIMFCDGDVIKKLEKILQWCVQHKKYPSQGAECMPEERQYYKFLYQNKKLETCTNSRIKNLMKKIREKEKNYKREKVSKCDDDMIQKLDDILQWCVQHKKYPSQGQSCTLEETQYYKFLYDLYQNKKLETCKNSRIKNLMKKIREKEKNYKQVKISKCDDDMIQKLEEILQWCKQHKKYPSSHQSCTTEERQYHQFLYKLYQNKKLETCKNSRIKSLMKEIREKETEYEQVKISKRDDVKIEKLDEILNWCVQHKKYPSRSQSCTQEERQYFEILRYQNEKLETCTNSRIKNLMKEIKEKETNYEQVKISKRDDETIEKLSKILQWCVQHKKYPSRSVVCTLEERQYNESLRYQNTKLETCKNSRIQNLMKKIHDYDMKIKYPPGTYIVTHSIRARETSEPSSKTTRSILKDISINLIDVQYFEDQKCIRGQTEKGDWITIKNFAYDGEVDVNVELFEDYTPGKFRAINRSVSTLNVDRKSKRKDEISVGAVLDVKEIKNHNDRIRGRLEDGSWISIAKLDGTRFLYFKRIKLDDDINCDSHDPKYCDNEDDKSEKFSVDRQLSKRKRKEKSNEKKVKDAIQKINKKYEHLNNEEKNRIYKGITYVPSRKKYQCKYWSKEEQRPRFVCESNNFGACVLNAKMKVKENLDTIPSDLASLIKNDNDKIDKINEKFKLLSNEEKGQIYNSITYLPTSKKFHCSYFNAEKHVAIVLSASIDFGTCVVKAQKKVKENLAIPRHVATLIKKTAFEINMMIEINKINEEVKNLSDKEKASMYSCICYDMTNSNFRCKYYSKQEEKKVCVCTSKNFGECVYKAQLIVKTNSNIPDYVAQLKSTEDPNKVKKEKELFQEELTKEEKDAISKINEKFKNLNDNDKESVYKSMHYDRSNKTFRCMYWNPDSKKHEKIINCKDFGKCVYKAQKIIESNSLIPKDIPIIRLIQHFTNESSDYIDFDRADKLIKKNIATIKKQIHHANTSRNIKENKDYNDEQNDYTDKKIERIDEEVDNTEKDMKGFSPEIGQRIRVTQSFFTDNKNVKIQLQREDTLVVIEKNNDGHIIVNTEKDEWKNHKWIKTKNFDKIELVQDNKDYSDFSEDSDDVYKFSESSANSEDNDSEESLDNWKPSQRKKNKKNEYKKKLKKKITNKDITTSKNFSNENESDEVFCSDEEEIQKSKKQNPQLFEEDDRVQVLEPFFTNNLSPEKLQKNTVLIVIKSIKVLPNRWLTLTDINYTQTYHVTPSNLSKLKLYLK